ncbi:hypothetical protein LXL04_024972 [Taraxacum kok-saghyz]
MVLFDVATKMVCTSWEPCYIFTTLPVLPILLKAYCMEREDLGAIQGLEKKKRCSFLSFSIDRSLSPFQHRDRSSASCSSCARRSSPVLDLLRRKPQQSRATVAVAPGFLRSPPSEPTAAPCFLRSLAYKSRKGLSLHKDSWNKVGRVLKENFGVDLTQKQMKNSYDNLKAKYIGWIYLKNKTGNLYNPQTNTFNITTEEWDEFKKGHPKAASLKTTPLLFPELCATLFDGNSATGNMRWISSETTSLAGSSSCPVPPLQLTGTSFHALDDDDDISHHSSGPFPDQASPPPVPSPNPNPNKRAKPSTPRAPPAGSPDQTSSVTPKPTLDDLTVDMQKALQKMVKGPVEHTVPECVEKLNNVLQLPQTVDDDEDEVQTHGTAADREFMTQLRDEIVEQLMQNVKKQTVFFLQTADVWSTFSAAEACRCGPQTADVLASKKQTAP